ncbi:ABC-three component system protein [Pseudalkalibacillus sp. A8]|uniref:ABC-three component system protein n=1 Tax=Pseudalkalibacillus sp. A8 TaxID=3382641 RepID=UPI0038B6A69E
MKPPLEFIKNEDKKNLLIFIHGFTGDSNTWANSQKQSLPEMLLEEEFVSQNFDVGYFNYFTKLLDFKKARFTSGIVGTLFGRSSRAQKNIGIKSLSDHLKSTIEIYCSDYDNIVLIAHSMGGLISKSYIIDELEENGDTKVKLFLSLAVPHKGSNWANIGKRLAKSNPQVMDLMPMSDFLDQVNDDWIQQKGKIPKTIYYYGQFDEVVGEKEATSYQVPKKLKVACNYDHFNICKPESKDSIVYRGIKKNLLEFKDELQFSKEMKTVKFVDDGKLDDENFVLKLLIADIHHHLIKDSKQTFFNAEYMVKAITNQGYSIEELDELYVNLERLYNIHFTKFLDGEYKSSNELVNKLYEDILDRDKEFLETTIPLIKVNQKTGMLQQLANSLDSDIWWAKNHSIKDLEEFRRVRDKSEE